MPARILCATALAAVAGLALGAEPPQPWSAIPDLTGPRSLGLSATLGAAAGNDALYVNPGAIAARKRYSVEAGAYLDRRGGRTVDRFVGGSVVDSMSAPVAAGVSYLRAQEGLYSGHVAHVALAGPLRDRFFLGVSGKWLSVEGPERTSAATVDAGLLWQLSDVVAVGAAGYNLVPIGNEVVAPMGAGAGIALGNDRSFQVTGDWRADFDRAGKTTNRYAAGIEVLLARLVPVRAGWSHDELLDAQWWSVGAGIVTSGGVALDVGYRQGIDDATARTIAATLKLFLFQ